MYIVSMIALMMIDDGDNGVQGWQQQRDEGWLGLVGKKGSKEQAFYDDLLSSQSEILWRLLVLGLTLSNKWLEDNTFTMKTW